MARYLTRQRKQLLKYLSEHTDEQMTARQIADALTAESISISAVYRNLSALEEEGILKRSIRENTREVYYQYISETREKISVPICSRIQKSITDLTAKSIISVLWDAAFTRRDIRLS